MDKSKKETILNKINNFLFSNDIPAEVVNKEVEQKFEVVLLSDGTTEITIEPAVEVNAAVVITAEDGTPVAAPAGEYELQDGRVIVLMEDGVVAEVREVSAVEEEPMAQDAPAEADKVKRIIERIESEKIFSKIEELEKTVKFLKKENEALIAKFQDTVDFSKETFKDVVELIGEAPTKEPVIKQKNPLKQFSMENGQKDVMAEWIKKHNTNEQ